jgi:predicted nucleic acid-binding protein
VCEAWASDTNEKLNRITIGELATAEVAAAFAILVRRVVVSKRIGEHAYKKFIGEFRGEYQIAHLTPALVLSAAELTQRHPLKAYDAVQLALALHANNLLKADDLSLTFVTSDKTLVQAAEHEGLVVENPQNHADLDQP